MGSPNGMTVDRRRDQIAASYKKQGYRVTLPSSADSLPAFLHDCHPDLIAEKEGDHVVIEVKPSRALKGANDLKALAERVAAEPGWRLELVALRIEDEDALVFAPGWLERMLQPPAFGADIAHHCVYLAEVLASLIRGTAVIHNIRVHDKTVPRLARELGFAGMLDQDQLAQIEEALDWRDHFMHRLPLSRSPDAQSALLEKLCRDLHAQAQNPED